MRILIALALACASLTFGQHLTFNAETIGRVPLGSSPSGACSPDGKTGTYVGYAVTCDQGVWLFTLGTVGDGLLKVGNQVSADTSELLDRETGQEGIDLTVTTAGTGSAYTGCPSDNTPAGKTITALVEGMRLWVIPHAAAVGGATTFDVCTLGAEGVKKADGTTNPDANQTVVGQGDWWWWDGTVWRLPEVTTPSPSGSYILSVEPTSAITNSGVSSANIIRWAKKYNPYPVSINRMWFRVGTASASQTAAVGIYNATCTTLLATTGAQSTTSANTAFEITFSPVVIPQGDLYFAYTISDTTATIATSNISATALIELIAAGSSIVGEADGTVTAGALPSSCGTLTPSGTSPRQIPLIAGWTE
jgi:hypothetical protein